MKKLILFFLFSLAALADPPRQIIFVLSDPGTCLANKLYINVTTGNEIVGTTGGCVAANVLAAKAVTPVISTVPGDLVCASAGDNTIGATTITGGSSTAFNITINAAAIPNYFRIPGTIIQVYGTTPAGYNVATATVISGTATTLTYTSANNPGAWSSGGTVALVCENGADAVYQTAQQTHILNSFNIPANTLIAGTTYRLDYVTTLWSSSAAPYFFPNLVYNGNVLWAPGIAFTPQNSESGILSVLSLSVVSLSPSPSYLLSVMNSYSQYLSAALNMYNSPPSIINTPTNGNYALVLTNGWKATGVVSGTYTSGIAATGTLGQTCTLSSFNNSSTATATVALTGTNTIAAATPLVITSKGQGATAAPTSATVGNGTATCTGPATIATVLGGAPGNAILVNSLIVRP